MAQSEGNKKDDRDKRLIPYGRQKIDKRDILSVVKVLRSDWLTQGPQVLLFEKKICEIVGAKFALAVSNGTTGLHLAYLAAGLRNGDEVIVPANTFAATANMLLAVGAKPVFCDIRMDTYNIDEEKIEKLISKKTKAIVPVHFGGHPACMEKILKLAKRRGLLVIEDACHALGASYKGRMIGGLPSDLTVFSFHPVKSITTGEGGMICTQNKTLYERLKLMRGHGIKKNEDGWNEMVMFGFNYRMSDIQASLGVSQASKLNSFISERRRQADVYKKEFAVDQDIITPLELAECGSSWHLYAVRLSDKFACSFEKIAKKLREEGIGIQRHYKPVYKHPYYAELGYRNGIAPNAERFYETEISLPLYPGLTKSDQLYVIGKVKRILSEMKDFK